MKRAWKILLVIGLLLGAVAWFWIVAQRPAPPPSGAIVLPDGSWVHIEAVTYGTNHLVGPRLAFVAARMPLPLRILMFRCFGGRAQIRFSATTDSPKLVLWLNRGMAGAFPTNLGNLKCVLSDTNGTTCGALVPFNARYSLEVEEFDVFPRREREIVLTIYYQDTNNLVVNRGSLTFANPVYGRYSTWKPEPLPATKHAGDLEVTLGKIRTGLDGKFNPAMVSANGAFACTTNCLNGTNWTGCVLRWHPTVNTNEVWRIAEVETCDATGNRITGTPLFQDNEAGYVLFSPALWATEPAWKVKFELIRVVGLGPDERFTVPAVPVGGLNATNRPGWTTNCNGVTVVLEQAVWSEKPELSLRLSGLTNDLRLDWLSARTDVGVALANSEQRGGVTNRTYRFNPLPPGTKSVDFSFAVQKRRWVEFLVKPEAGQLRLENASENKPTN